MVTIAWVTDPHFDCLPSGGSKAFGEGVREDVPGLTHVVISGDLANFENYDAFLKQFQEGVGVPVYFVTGNHDAWNGSIKRMRAKSKKTPGWLPQEQLVQLADKVVLVGHDGWYDARWGHPETSLVLLNDFFMIQELKPFSGHFLFLKLREIADSFAAEAQGLLEGALQAGNKHIVFATHVPPFPQAAWHEGKISDGHWLPWMSSKAMGDVLDALAYENPDVRFTVLCGHTHGKGVYHHARNMVVYTGESEYRSPRISKVFTIKDFPFG